MFFHIDEAGNTGNNLFDENQPKLSYGVLSSPKNVDALGKSIHRKIQRETGAELLHANELGYEGLRRIAPWLLELQKKMGFDFDYYFIEKPTYALVLFFDAVFDAGLNEAVRWETYWTPMRFVLIHKLAELFDDYLLKESWRLNMAKRIERYEDDIVALLSELRERAKASMLDERSKEVMVDAFEFGMARPLSLDFGFPDQRMVSPNAVCFQFVVSSIARRVRKKSRKNASAIIVDRQSQFNRAQAGTHYNQARITEGIRSSSGRERRMYINHPLFVNFTEDEITNRGLPDKELTFCKSSDSVGLQIVDVYLWIANKVFAGDELPEELEQLWSRVSGRSYIDGISMQGMMQRYMEFEKLLPKMADLTEDQVEFGRNSVEEHRKKVQSLNGS